MEMQRKWRVIKRNPRGRSLNIKCKNAFLPDKQNFGFIEISYWGAIETTGMMQTGFHGKEQEAILWRI
jgi:hypothetical protein